jgi:plasmid stabilization system protein ParE
MTGYTLAPEARRDLDDIWDYLGIQVDNPNAACRVVETLHEKSELLARHPLMVERRQDLGEDLRAFVARRYVVV